MHPIEGLVLHQVAYDDPAPAGQGAGSRRRSVLYRAAMAEMVVPYGDPQPQHFWRHVFDEGEVGMGRTANPLELGCDCLGEIRYLDAPMILGDGTVAVVGNAICIHEEDFGVLWRHRDRFAERTEVRRDRRLVVSYWATLGNYDYGYFWYFHQDGSIELEVKLTGIPLASALPAGRPAGPTRPGWRPSCPPPTTSTSSAGGSTSTSTARPTASRRSTSWPTRRGRRTPTATPSGGWPPRCGGSRRPSAAPTRWPAARWLVSNPAVRNAYGDPVGYQVQLGPSPVLLAAEGSTVARRAALRPPPPVGHPLRPGGAARRRRASDPAPRRRRPARLHRR